MKTKNLVRVSIAAALSTSLLAGCSALNTDSTGSAAAEPTTQTYWVNSLKANCVGVGPMTCLQVQKGEKQVSGDWQMFYAPIQGFDYEQGYLYKLRVKETRLPADKVPADASSIAYELVEVLEKQADSKLRLHDLWVLEAIEGQPLELNNERQRPRLEINLQEMRVSGTDGCNRVFGGIQEVTADTLVFGPIAATQMACLNMEVPDQFQQRLSNIRGYSLQGLKLHLLDARGQPMLSFQKTD